MVNVLKRDFFQKDNASYYIHTSSKNIKMSTHDPAYMTNLIWSFSFSSELIKAYYVDES